MNFSTLKKSFPSSSSFWVVHFDVCQRFTWKLSIVDNRKREEKKFDTVNWALEVLGWTEHWNVGEKDTQSHLGNSKKDKAVMMQSAKQNKSKGSSE